MSASQQERESRLIGNYSRNLLYRIRDRANEYLHHFPDAPRDEIVETISFSPDEVPTVDMGLAVLNQIKVLELSPRDVNQVRVRLVEGETNPRDGSPRWTYEVDRRNVQPPEPPRSFNRKPDGISRDEIGREAELRSGEKPAGAAEGSRQEDLKTKEVQLREILQGVTVVNHTVVNHEERRGGIEERAIRSMLNVLRIAEQYPEIEGTIFGYDGHRVIMVLVYGVDLSRLTLGERLGLFPELDIPLHNLRLLYPVGVGQVERGAHPERTDEQILAAVDRNAKYGGTIQNTVAVVTEVDALGPAQAAEPEVAQTPVRQKRKMSEEAMAATYRIWQMHDIDSKIGVGTHGDRRITAQTTSFFRKSVDAGILQIRTDPDGSVTYLRQAGLYVSGGSEEYAEINVATGMVEPNMFTPKESSLPADLAALLKEMEEYRDLHNQSLEEGSRRIVLDESGQVQFDLAYQDINDGFFRFDRVNLSTGQRRSRDGLHFGLISGVVLFFFQIEADRLNADPVEARRLIEKYKDVRLTGSTD